MSMSPQPPPEHSAPHALTPAVQVALDRVMQTYDLLATVAAQSRREALGPLTTYLETLHAAGETDPHRLAVCGLTYLRERDGSIDSVKAGFTGL